ncbi:MAG: response regulator [Calditrichota bacterium]
MNAFEKPPADAPKRILVIEDEPDIRNFIAEYLQDQGYEVITSMDGLDGLYQARTQSPDLVLLDVMLPKLNGFAICRLLKYDQNFHDIPVILWSWKDEDKDLEEGKASGADAYVPKPFSLPKLGEKIAELIFLRPVKKLS